MSKTPPYDALPVIEATGDAHAWDVWGRDDELGSVNRLGPAQVAAAARLVRDGRVINLTLPLDEPAPGLSADREGYRHHIEVRRQGRDDSLDNFYLQFSSQWDGLRHIRYREFGYWGGRQEADLDAGALGIERWARHGIIGRGVLVDVPRFMERGSRAYALDERAPIGPSLLEAILEDQGVAPETGDILLLRTGWLAWYLELDAGARQALRGSLHPGEGGLHCPGLDPTRATAAWLWDHGVAAIAADNPALEALPVDREQGFQHRRLMPLLGMPIGEFWQLDELAADCASDGRYACMLVSAPLHLPGGVGSPANAYAVK
jgi:kynurenine formamidase